MIRRSRLMWWLPGKHWRNDGWRWRVANLVDKLPGQCWSDLVSWVLRYDTDDAYDRDVPWRVRLLTWLPWRPQRGCGEGVDFARNGSCYCAKVCTPEFAAEIKAAADAAERAS